MSQLKEQIEKLREDLYSRLESATHLKDLEDIKVAFLGKKGFLVKLMGIFRALSLDEKRKTGPLLQHFKQEIEERVSREKKLVIERQAHAATQKQQNFDVTAYVPKISVGRFHPYTHFIEQIQDIFLSMGYEIWDGPEFVSDFYNFTALNIPPDHPARDMHDTFWSDKPDYLMRTHTSTVQIKAMENKKPPLAGIAPGRTYRYEDVDASHDFMFMQCEGLLIDKNITVSHLFATAQTFLKALFKKDTLDIRIRPGYFPFVEPGFEIDMRCIFCKNGCSVCKQSTWIEIFPGGLVHPNVLKSGGIDSNEYSGFAFGFGLTRLAMLLYGIDDIRLFYSGKLKFLEQF